MPPFVRLKVPLPDGTAELLLDEERLVVRFETLGGLTAENYEYRVGRKGLFRFSRLDVASQEGMPRPGQVSEVIRQELLREEDVKNHENRDLELQYGRHYVGPQEFDYVHRLLRLSRIQPLSVEVFNDLAIDRIRNRTYERGIEETDALLVGARYTDYIKSYIRSYGGNPDDPKAPLFTQSTKRSYGSHNWVEEVQVAEVLDPTGVKSPTVLLRLDYTGPPPEGFKHQGDDASSQPLLTRSISLGYTTSHGMFTFRRQGIIAAVDGSRIYHTLPNRFMLADEVELRRLCVLLEGRRRFHA